MSCNFVRPADIEPTGQEIRDPGRTRVAPQQFRSMIEFMKKPLPDLSDDPRGEYTQRLKASQSAQAVYEGQHRRIGFGQIALGAIALVLAVLALVFKVISVFWAPAPVIAIIILAILHDGVLKRRERCSRTAAYYQQALARIDHRWMGTGETGERFHSATHPYSRDLDIFGEGSLFELLCSARTRVGQETLANWLLAPASPDQVRARQGAVDNMRARLDLRKDLAVLARDSGALTPAEALAAWGEGKPALASKLLRSACATLAVLWLASLVVWLAWGMAYPALLLSVVNVGISLAYRHQLDKTVSDIESAVRDLGLFAGVLARMETEQFATPRLIELRACLQSQGWPPSRWIARLNRLMEYLDSRRNLIVKALDLFLLWTLQCACAH